MLRTRLAAALAASALALTLGVGAAALDLTVPVDHARAVRLSEAASAVIVGNPVIADVTPHDENMFLITGKSFGSTNIIALDQDGRQIYSAEIRVVGANGGRLTVHRGLARESYHCVGACERIPVPGDFVESFDNVLSSTMKTIDAANSESDPK